MCVMIHGLKKNLKREEQLRGMETNPYGFALLVLRGGRVACHLRTLNKDELMKAWDQAEESDYVITHSRIPSAGGMTKNLDDCHLWDAEGCYFAHNGTMRNVTELMGREDRRTDSKWLFDEVFLPLWRLQGKAYTPLLERVMALASWGSRLLIVTPDGEVHMTGDWIEDHECWFSNRSYVVPKPVETPTWRRADGAWQMEFVPRGTVMVGPGLQKPAVVQAVPAAKAPPEPEETDEVEGLTVSDGTVLRTALLHYVATWAAARRVEDTARDISRMVDVPESDMRAEVRATVEATEPEFFCGTKRFVVKDMGDYIAKGRFDELAEAYRSAFMDDMYMNEGDLMGVVPDEAYPTFQSQLLAHAWAVGIRYRAKARKVDRAFTCMKVDGKPLPLATLTGMAVKKLQALHEAALGKD